MTVWAACFFFFSFFIIDRNLVGSFLMDGWLWMLPDENVCHEWWYEICGLQNQPLHLYTQKNDKNLFGHWGLYSRTCRLWSWNAMSNEFIGLCWPILHMQLVRKVLMNAIQVTLFLCTFKAAVDFPYQTTVCSSLNIDELVHTSLVSVCALNRSGSWL